MPSTVVRSIGYEDRLSIVDHLDELRTRLIVCIAAVAVCFAFTYWQKDAVLTAINKPFTTSQKAKASDKNSTLSGLQQSNRYNRANDDALSAFGTVLSTQQNVLRKLAASGNAPAATLAQLAQSQRQLAAAVQKAKATTKVVPDATSRH
jgi:sec-independent protein translocase protein TatC